ncbi:hypothetical protein [Thiobacillus sp. 63-78]|uniref:hypothetical protein n=1 Tax=Thiobacillus sp. 63-78 TaxID=1895859 RepID=UPI0025DE2CC7|nr:hypothetical protein [Thiobacillus sp. 63-78]
MSAASWQARLGSQCQSRQLIEGWNEWHALKQFVMKKTREYLLPQLDAHRAATSKPEKAEAPEQDRMERRLR